MVTLMGKKKSNSVVKIDSELLAEVEAFINLSENRFRYVNRKQFIDMAVADYLRREKKRLKK
jgi:metal-responsive CopG/Arc/MetJ family transcriptional regulator